MMVSWKRRICLAGGQVDRAAHWAPSNGARPDIGKAVQTNGGGVTRNAEGGEAMDTLRLSATVGCLIFGLMLSALEEHTRHRGPVVSQHIHAGSVLAWALMLTVRRQEVPE